MPKKSTLNLPRILFEVIRRCQPCEEDVIAISGSAVHAESTHCNDVDIYVFSNTAGPLRSQVFKNDDIYIDLFIFNPLQFAKKMHQEVCSGRCAKLNILSSAQFFDHSGNPIQQSSTSAHNKIVGNLQAALNFCKALPIPQQPRSIFRFSMERKLLELSISQRKCDQVAIMLNLIQGLEQHFHLMNGRHALGGKHFFRDLESQHPDFLVNLMSGMEAVMRGDATHFSKTISNWLISTTPDCPEEIEIEDAAA